MINFGLEVHPKSGFVGIILCGIDSALEYILISVVYYYPLEVFLRSCSRYLLAISINGPLNQVAIVVEVEHHLQTVIFPPRVTRGMDILIFIIYDGSSEVYTIWI